jgi:hypothetical protein
MVGMAQHSQRTQIVLGNRCFRVRYDLVGLWISQFHAMESLILAKKKERLMKPPEYREGTEARKNFERGLKALFRVPKTALPAKKSKKQASTLRKAKLSDKD